MHRYTTLIFDLDGTLIDSAPDIHGAANAALRAVDRPPLDLATITSFIGNGVETLMERSLEATGGSDAALRKRALDILLDVYDAHNVTLTQVYPGVFDVLESLKAQGIKLGLCTNKPHAPALAICEKFGLDGYFDALHGARAGVARKPDAASLHNCMAELGGAAQCTLYVGDSQVDHKTAHNAGVDFALFTGGYLNGPLEGPPPLVRFSQWSQNCFTDLTSPRA